MRGFTRRAIPAGPFHEGGAVAGLVATALVAMGARSVGPDGCCSPGQRKPFTSRVNTQDDGPRALDHLASSVRQAGTS